ncbi:hypothetical protein DITRI_Ditri02bG0000200 [Diplodiscus trichospermus]
MASSGNLNPQTQSGAGGGGGGFDMNKLFKPSSSPMLQHQHHQNMNVISTPPSPSPSPNTTNLTTSPSFPAQSSTPPPPPYLTPSSSYPPPTGPYPFHHPHYLPYPPPPQHQHPFHPHPHPHQPQLNINRPIPYQAQPQPSPPSAPTSGSDLLMAFFGTPTQTQSQVPAPASVPSAAPHNMNATPSSPSPSPVRLLSSKAPKGRHLFGTNLLYDIHVRLPGEVQPQLEVTPITKYASDPGLIFGRQIAVNRNYICYGLKLGNIRILNINTALRSLLRGHTQRVTDMAFFAEDVHLLASASVDGRIFVWKINEGPDDEDKPQILGKAVIAIQIVGQEESMHPRVCWHPHKQEILMVAIGNRILKIDTIKVGKLEGFSAEEPLNCFVDKLIDGIQFVGKHEGEITELSMCQWLTTRLASASVDGMVKIWEDRKALPLAVLRPHDGHPVNSATFLTAPHRPDHIVLITGGPLNREVKIWASASEEGWLLPSDGESWHCTQTLELRSSAESKVENAFFNQVVALPRAGLLLLANAKKNAIYAVHIDYGPNPAATCMDYIAEFTVTMPILSLTGTSDSLPGGEHAIQVYCVQTQAIQQYALDLSQCLPPPLENADLEKTDSNVARVYDAVNSDGSASLELSHVHKPTDMTLNSSVPLSHIHSSSSESATMASRPQKLASSEVTFVTESAASGMESKPVALQSHSSSENMHTATSPIPLSPKLSRNSSGFRSPSSTDHVGNHSAHDQSVDSKVDAVKENKIEMPSSGDHLREGEDLAKNDRSIVPDPPAVFKPPTHLVTPSEILSNVVPLSENAQISKDINAGEATVEDVVVKNDAKSIEQEVEVHGESGLCQTNEAECPQDSHTAVADNKEKAFYSQASDLGIQMARDFCTETCGVEGAQVNDVGIAGQADRLNHAGDGEDQNVMKDVPPKVGETNTVLTVSPSLSSAKGKKQKGKNSQVSGPSSPSTSPYNSTDSSNEPGCSSTALSPDAVFPQLLAMQNVLEQVVSAQKEMEKQMNAIVSGPVNKEGKRLEASLGRSVEKIVKANTDALWARIQDENAKHEKSERDRMQQITNLITNCINKDLAAMFEKSLKKEITAVGPVVARAISPTLEKSISSAITDSFQKGVGERAVNQLEKSVGSKVEGTVARQIQSQFQTSGKQALQDALRSSLESSIIPAFEMSCKSMFEQIDVTFQNWLFKHTTAAQQHFENSHSSLVVALQDAINSATSITQTLSGELANGQRKLLAIAAAGANSQAGNPLVTQLSNGPLAHLHEMQPEAHVDPTKELARMMAERKYDEAFTAALHRSDVSIVSWLCSQVDLQGILSMKPCPLSQGVLLALFQQLACDINKETSRKLAWMTDVAVAINPSDPMIAVHVLPIFRQVCQIVDHLQSLPSTSASDSASIRVLKFVINSVLS